MRKLIIIFSIFTILLAGVALLTPWKTVLETQLKSALTNHGFSNVNLHVAGLSLSGIVLEDMTFGAEDPLTLKNVKINYTLAGLRARQLQGLTISSPALVMKQEEGRWSLVGMESLLKPSTETNPVSVTSMTEMLNKIPFGKVNVEDGTLGILATDWNLSLPLDAAYDKTSSKIVYQATGVEFHKGNITAKTGIITADITFDQATQVWKGTWQADRIEIEGAAAPVPALQGKGTISASGNTITVEGVLQSDDKSHLLQFRYDHSFDMAKPSVMTVVSAAMPWKEGRIGLKNAQIAVGVRRTINLNVDVDNVSVSELLGAVTGERVTATGRISGVVPVTLTEQGDLIFRKGSLSAREAGKIIMPPDAIPGDNEQVALVRDILADLNYTVLSITMNTDENNNLGILMTVEGNNPAVYNGRAVKLNVNLTGDVLDFIRQNVMLLTKPETLWEQNKNE